MKLTLLDMVQRVLSSIDGDFVNSIDDTQEAEQIAYLLRDEYQWMMSTKDWPHMRQLVDLTNLSDLKRPTHLLIPDTVSRIEWINYNMRDEDDTDEDYRRIHYLHPTDFLTFTNKRNTGEANTILSKSIPGADFIVKTDDEPRYWTSFDDDHIIFDSYDSNIENTVQSSKVQCLAYKRPVFKLVDNFTPDLPDEAFAILLQSVKQLAALELTQTDNPEAGRRARTGTRWLSQQSWRARGGVRFPDYGRRSPKTTYSSKNQLPED